MKIFKFLIFSLLLLACLGSHAGQLTIVDVDYAKLAYENLQKNQTLSLEGTGYAEYQHQKDGSSGFEEIDGVTRNTQSFIVKKLDEIILNPNIITLDAYTLKSSVIGYRNDAIGYIPNLENGSQYAPYFNILNLDKGDIIEIISSTKPYGYINIQDSRAEETSLTFGEDNYKVYKTTAEIRPIYDFEVGCNASFKIDGYICSIKVYRKEFPFQPFVAYGLNANIPLPISGNQDNKSVEYGSPTTFSFEVLTSDGFIANGNKNDYASLIQVDLIDSQEIKSNNNYQSIRLGQGEYKLACSSNITSVKIHLFAISDNIRIWLDDNKQYSEISPSRNRTLDIQSSFRLETDYNAEALAVFEIYWKEEEQQEPVKVTVGLPENVEWCPDFATGQMTLTENSPFKGLGLVSCDQGIYLEDLGLTYSFEPVTKDEGSEGFWAKQPNEWSENCGIKYKEVWDQMIAIQEKSNVDGYYYTKEDMKRDVNEDGDIIPFFPCSGKYRLVVESDKKNVDIKYPEGNIFTVYPSLQLMYEYKKDGQSVKEGMNINGFSLGADGASLVIDKSLKDNPDKLKQMRLYIPGVYLADITYSYGSQTRAAANSNTISNGDEIDLSNLKEGGDTIHFSLSKNGAATPIGNDGYSEQKILVTFGDTAVGIFDIEDTVDPNHNTTVEYYNLQGLKVENPQKGVFIKVTGGKAEKVLM